MLVRIKPSGGSGLSFRNVLLLKSPVPVGAGDSYFEGSPGRLFELAGLQLNSDRRSCESIRVFPASVGPM